ncbi:OmpA family protein [Burkholderia stagnalis]
MGDYWPPQTDVLFDFDRATIEPSGKQKLDDLVGKLAGWNVEGVVATGFTDHLGTLTYNATLSLRRALAVRAYLISKGVRAKIYAEGKGAHNPVTTGCNERAHVRVVACLAPDRRVETVIIGTPKR